MEFTQKLLHGIKYVKKLYFLFASDAHNNRAMFPPPVDGSMVNWCWCIWENLLQRFETWVLSLWRAGLEEWWEHVPCSIPALRQMYVEFVVRFASLQGFSPSLLKNQLPNSNSTMIEDSRENQLRQTWLPLSKYFNFFYLARVVTQWSEVQSSP